MYLSKIQKNHQKKKLVKLIGEFRKVAGCKNLQAKVNWGVRIHLSLVRNIWKY